MGWIKFPFQTPPDKNESLVKTLEKRKSKLYASAHKLPATKKTSKK